MDLDDFDRRILALLRRDSRRTGGQLAEAVGLSPAACLRRVQRLRASGAIEREVAVLSPKVEPAATRVLVLLTLSRDNPQRVDQLVRRLRALPEVERILHVTGPSDLAMIVRCASMEAYAAFTEAHLFAPPLTGFDSLVVLRDFEGGEDPDARA